MIITSKVTSIEPLASNTFRILLHPETSVNFCAGQYLMVVMGEDDKRPFSIASSPCRHNGELELHIGAAEHNPYAQQVVDTMRAALASGESITIDAPHGDAWIREESSNELLLIAGGTGFSYVRSILDHCISQKVTRPITLYWGGRDESQLYAKAELELIAEQNDNVRFVPVIEESKAGWTGAIGNVLQAVNSDFDTLANQDIYIAGRFEMAGAARDQFIADKQAKRENIYADAYAFM